MKSGSLNFLEPSGPLQACNGTALLITYYFSTGKIIHERAPVLRYMYIACLKSLEFSWHRVRQYYMAAYKN